MIDTAKRLLKTSSPETGPSVTVRFVGTLVSAYLPLQFCPIRTGL